MARTGGRTCRSRGETERQARRTIPVRPRPQIRRPCWPRWTRSSGRWPWPPRGPVCVLAGAGTGKTRAVAHRIAYAALTGVVDPAHVLAVTFTTRAAGELRARLVQLAGTGGGLERVQARTFHSAALRQLGPLLAAHRGRAAARPCWIPRSSLLAEAARGLRVSAGAAELRDVASEIEWAKVSQVRPDDYPGASAKAAPHPAAGRRGGGPALRPLRGAAPGASPGGLRVRAGAHRGHPRRARGRRPRGPGPVPLFRDRRVPGRQPAAEAAAGQLGRGP